MAGAARRSVALLLAGAAGLPGCSFLTARPPPERFADPTRPIARFDACPAAAPVLDAVLAALLGAGAVKVATGEPPKGGSVALGTLAGLAVASSVYGFQTRGRCARVEELNASCMKGDRAACLALAPDDQPGSPKAAPLLCAADASCGPGSRCVASACVPAPGPVPVAPSPAGEPPAPPVKAP